MPRLPDNVHYWLIGGGPETERIRAAVLHRELAARVRLLGTLSDDQVSAVYRRADLFLMPNIPTANTMEGFGVVILEAGLCGVATVASRLEGLEDAVMEGENGHLVESGNPAAFAEILNFYHRDRSALGELRRRTIAATQRFRWDVVVDRHLMVMRAVLAGTAPAAVTVG